MADLKKIAPLAIALGLGVGAAFMNPIGVANAGRKRPDIADRDPALYKGDWVRQPDGGFRFTAFGHAFDVNGKPIRLIEVDSVACESSSWANGLSQCLIEFKKANGLDKP